MTDKKQVLSFGGGVNSTAILVLAKQQKIKLDLVVFSDTGAEMPETYQYLNDVVLPYCKTHNLEFVTVGSPTLYMDYFSKKIIPYRMFRSCTDKYKIRPITAYLKKRYGSKNYDIILGIDAGETQRAKNGAIYPLIELNIDRAGCERVIENDGLPIPIKSGCFFCPFQKESEWTKLYRNHKDLFFKSEEFEKNCKAYPQFFLGPVPLEKIRLAITEQRTLFKTDKSVSMCCFCHS